jgi:hypothetical protein
MVKEVAVYLMDCCYKVFDVFALVLSCMECIELKKPSLISLGAIWDGALSSVAVDKSSINYGK